MTTSLFDSVKYNLQVIYDNIAEASISSGRNPDDIRMMAVTKTVDIEKINFAIDNCGVSLIGENKVQEFLLKRDELHLDGVEKHLIGHLQTNKVKKILPYVDMIQSVDSFKLAQVISQESEKLNINTNILLELNIGGEESKTGFGKTQFFEDLDKISALSNITVKGLMTIPPICDNELELEKYFDNMQNYYFEIKEKSFDNFDFSVLSMGMSGDYKQAITHGSNLVRIGSAIFGARIYK